MGDNACSGINPGPLAIHIMISCSDCKHYSGSRFQSCKTIDAKGFVYETNPYDGVTKWVPQWRPSILSMRKEGGDCGPDAVLFEPSRWKRFKTFIGRVAQR